MKIIESINDLKGIDKLILPGVGAFDYAMEKFNNSGLKDEIIKLVLKDEVPILGICVGMQVLANSSEEGNLPGLGYIKGHVKRLDDSKLYQKPKLPHMGWNTVSAGTGSSLFKGVENESFYFVHSYAVKKQVGAIATMAHHGEDFLAAVEDGVIAATQFHPEKSGDAGLHLIKNWTDSL